MAIGMRNLSFEAVYRIFYWLKPKYILLLFIIILTTLIYYFCLPESLFKVAYATVLEDRKGNLLGASIANDGQWRFPQTDSVSEKFKLAITHFEDQYLDHHPGFNPFSLGRASWQNLKAGKVVSGGSTLTMQVIRMARQQNRTIWEKTKEILLATRLELACSKEEILNLYASHAPFGGNVVGIDAAAWRYFGRSAHQLSWAENALLAVLPNSPSLIYPGKNHEALLEKRNLLLHKLLTNRIIDSITYQLALAEDIPSRPHALPNLAPHLLTRMGNEGLKGKRIRSTLEADLQQKVSALLHRHHLQLKANHIFNGAVLVLDVKTGNALAYVGNTQAGTAHGEAVDIITAPRSTGSILKPFLYAAMLDEGQILPHSLIPDVPTFIDGFAPKNFDQSFEGAVPADEVIARSLNVPAVHMLRNYGVEKFHYLLGKMGMNTLTQPPGHYGLSLILGGAEGSLWDITGIYASMARTLNGFFKSPPPDRYDKADFHAPIWYEKVNQTTVHDKSESSWLHAASIWFTFKAMLEVVRPEAEAGWEYYSTAKKIAWKTGTSFGFRDAWAVGVTPEYVIGVWTGNADGEGRPGLTGVQAAAPILFDIADIMPNTDWFDSPGSEMTEILVSQKSGYRASLQCDDTVRVFVPQTGLRSEVCDYHQLVHLDDSGNFRVQSQCVRVDEMKHQTWFVLPATQEWYYRIKHPTYRTLPPFRPDCMPEGELVQPMELIYPMKNAKIRVPRELDGQTGRAVFEAAHRNPTAKIFWHLDENYIGETSNVHQMAFSPLPGMHTLTLVDENGVMISSSFEIL